MRRVKLKLLRKVGWLVVSKKINTKFLKFYNEMDAACCAKFGVSTGGVGEYINRLNNARYAPDREEVLPLLVKYKAAFKRFNGVANAVKKDKEFTKDDLKWIQEFTRKVTKQRDPISLYLKKAKKYASKEKTTTTLCVILGILAVAGIVAAIILL